ncbi:MAG: hypothetical protein GY749_25540 [Desulfobacteraceae bacterium]|nr:hypothetical protein [Desulfobacteraceae bacterium]
MEKKEITIHSGTMIWKSGPEYFNDKMFLHGYPYYRITEVDGLYYLWELDPDDPDSGKYRIMKTGSEFIPFHKEGMALSDKISEKLYADRHNRYQDIFKKSEK